jgi:hypothetical protein
VPTERRLISRDRWHLTNTVSPQPITQKTNFLVDTLTLFPVSSSDKSTKAHKINAGYHEWDFKFKMPSNLDQSVEGLPTNWVVYNLKATVDRGYMSKQLSATSHIRVIRTLGRDMLESMPMEQVSRADIQGRAQLTILRRSTRIFGRTRLPTRSRSPRRTTSSAHRLLLTSY